MTSTQTLARVLNLLAAPYDEQIHALPGFVVVADEIALLFDDEMIRLRTTGILDQVAPTAQAILMELDARLDTMSGTKEYWTQDALRVSEEWNWVRERAHAALAAMGEPRSPPSVDWVTFTRG